MTAFGAAAAAVPGVALAAASAAPTEAAVAEAGQIHQLAIPKPTFKPIASATQFGTPTDISMGWDGTLWAIDASGAPHIYDPVGNTWQPHGEGLSAATWVGTTLYWFLGDEVATAPFGGQVSAPQTIAAAFPNLPDSFKYGVCGAANIDGALVLFSSGRYVTASGGASTSLIGLTNWPTTGVWADGLVDAVHSDGTANVLLFRGAQFVTANLQTKAVTTNPAPISSYAPWQNRIPAAWAASGFDAAFTQGGNVVVYNGPALATFDAQTSSPVSPQYIAAPNSGSWPDTWHPQMAHAPSGRVGSLWVATTKSPIVWHDGERWNQGTQNAAGNSVGVGKDGIVYATSTGGLFRFDGTTWTQMSAPPATLQQVAVGDDGHVWVRDPNNVHSFSHTNNTYTVVSLGAGVLNPTHMAANADGTLWHCNNTVATPFRFLSESGTASASASVPVQAGVVTSVQKVASTGFGQAHVLTTTTSGTQLYSYDSPYLFKTADSFLAMGNGDDGFNPTGAVMVHGGGRLYGLQFLNLVPGIAFNVSFFALDAHTGELLASYQPTAPKLQYTGLVYDEIHKLLYVGAAPWTDDTGSGAYDQTTPGHLIALDAETLQVKWTFNTAAGVDAPPQLKGTQLCFGDRQGHLYMLNTNTALAAAPAPTPEWTWDLPVSPAQTHRVTTPAIYNGQIFVAVWDINVDCQDPCVTGSGVFMCICNTDGTQRSPYYTIDTTDNQTVMPGITNTPVLGYANFADPVTDPPKIQPAVFLNGYQRVYAVSLVDLDPADNYATVQAWGMTSGTVYTNFAYDDGTRIGQPLPDPQTPPNQKFPVPPALLPQRLWFGDTLGNLWALDPLASGLTPTDGTPYLVDSSPSVQLSIKTTPVLYKDPQGGMTVLFGVYDQKNVLPQGLYGYDPVNHNGASVATGVTYINVLTNSAENGVVYGGGISFAASAQRPSQVFGIRVDEIPQALRDFVIESQMMQDPDVNAPGGDTSNQDDPTPPSYARYQTNLTVVDDQKKPQPHEPVKIWADEVTTIMVEGKSYDIGPGDSQFALLKTGVDGQIVISSGYAKTDNTGKPTGTDTPDMYAPPLRVWASFMDPYERIVVNPDHEFHGRVSTSHANAADDDPDKVNLQTTKSYVATSGHSGSHTAPQALFTADEKNANQPQNCATAVGQMKNGVGFGNKDSANVTASLFSRLMLHNSGRRPAQRAIRAGQYRASAANAAPPKYVAYTDLTGSGYFPTNIPAKRPTHVAQATGLILSKPQGQPTTATTVQTVHHTVAAAAFDALPAASANPPWGNAFNATRQADGVFVIQGTRNIFTDFWNWLKHLVAEITDLIVTIADDVAVAIKMFVNDVEQVFKAIIKVIDDIAAAIGSFFKMLLKWIEDVIAALSILFHFGEIMWTHRWLAAQFQSRVKNITDAISGTIQPAVDGFFANSEDQVKAFFDGMRAKLTGTQQLSDVKGADATEHTAFTVGPRGGTASSHATQCSWGTQRLKSGMPSATQGSSLQVAAVDGVSNDPVSDFFNSFVARMTGIGDLSSSVNQLKSDFGNLFQAKSVSQFFETLLLTLLDVVETMVLGALAVANAFIDGIFKLIEDAFNAVVGILTTEIEIPILTWLYEKLFGEPLTFLNVASLVAAIPVTLIFRIVESKYPSQAGLPSASAMTTMSASGVQVASPLAQEVLGMFVAVFDLVAGCANCIADASDDAPIASKISAGTAFLINAFTFPSIGNDNVSTADWVVYGCGLGVMLVGIGGVSYTGSDGQPTSPIPGPVQSVLYCIMNVVALVAEITAYVLDGKSDPPTNVGFASAIIGALDGMLNPVKLSGGEAQGVVAAVDVLAGIIQLFLGIYTAIAANESAIRPGTRLHLPYVPYGGHGPLPAAVSGRWPVDSGQ